MVNGEIFEGSNFKLQTSNLKPQISCILYLVFVTVFYFCLMINNICIVGAGTMGSGIALNAAQNNFPVILFDINESVLTNAKVGLDKILDLQVEKQKITLQEKERVISNILFTAELPNCKADLIIEAIIEKREAKTELFISLAAINNEEVIFASNTSSLSISEIQAQVPNPERVLGMHFFNPAHIMKLVEVIKGKATSDLAAQLVMDLCTRLGKTPVLCKDSPGFIVNRVARHYYLEAMKLVENKVATLETVDAVMESSGFRMGPFKLMDLIGLDINLAVSTSIYEAFDKAERFRPSPLQIEKVEKKELGRKTGKGFYNYNG